MKECPKCHRIVNSKYCPDCGIDLSKFKEKTDVSNILDEKEIMYFNNREYESPDFGSEGSDDEGFIDYTLKYRNDFVAWLDKIGCEYEDDPYPLAISYKTELECKLKECRVHVYFTDLGYIIEIPTNWYLEKPYIEEMATYLLRANEDPSQAHFQIDINNQIVVSLDFESWVGFLVEPQIESNLLDAVSLLDAYGNGIIALSMGLSNVEEEITKAKSNKKYIYSIFGGEEDVECENHDLNDISF